DALPTRSLDGAHPAPPTGCTSPAAALSVGRSGGTTKFTKAARSLVTETGHLHLLTTQSMLPDRPESSWRVAQAWVRSGFRKPRPASYNLHGRCMAATRGLHGRSGPGDARP